MGHLRLVLLMAGTALAGYLCLCLVAPTELDFSWKSPCGSGEWPASPTVPFPWWDMACAADASDSNIRVLQGRWGTHRIHAHEATDGQGACVMRLSWASTRWPFFLRGAAAMANVHGAARQTAYVWFPPLSEEGDE